MPIIFLDTYLCLGLLQEDNNIDLDNPLMYGTLLNDLRKNESRKKSKKDKANDQFSVIQEGVKEVVGQGIIIVIIYY